MRTVTTVLVAALLALAVAPAPAGATDFATTASGSWRFVRALGPSFGVHAGQPALVLEQAALPFGLANWTGEDDDDEDDGFLERSSRYVIVAAGLAGSAFLASELFDGGDPAGTGATGGGSTTFDPVGPNGPVTPLSPTGPTAPFPPETTVPEPITMTLLATGLAGVGGARWRRRRQLGT